MNARLGASSDPQLTVTGPKAALVGVVLQPATGHRLAEAGQVELRGDATALTDLAAVLDEFDPNFNIVTP